MDRPKSLENIFIRYDVSSQQVALIGAGRHLQEHIQRYGSAIVRDLMTDTPVEVYEGQGCLMGRPLGVVGRVRAVPVKH